MDSRVFLFSREEYMVLAAAAGIRQMYGFIRDVTDPDEQSILQAMQSLFEKELLVSTGGAFQLREPAVSLFYQIKNAVTMLEVHKKSGRKCIIYIGTGGVKVMPSMNRKDMFVVQQIPTGEIWNHLTEEGWIPESREERE